MINFSAIWRYLYPICTFILQVISNEVPLHSVSGSRDVLQRVSETRYSASLHAAAYTTTLTHHASRITHYKPNNQPAILMYSYNWPVKPGHYSAFAVAAPAVGFEVAVGCGMRDDDE